MASQQCGEGPSNGARKQRVLSGFRPEPVERPALMPIVKPSESRSAIQELFTSLKKQTQEASAAIRQRLGRTPKKSDFTGTQLRDYNKVKTLRATLWPGYSKRRERSPVEPPGVKPLDCSSAGPLPPLPQPPPKAAQSLLPSLAATDHEETDVGGGGERPPAPTASAAPAPTLTGGKGPGGRPPWPAAGLALRDPALASTMPLATRLRAAAVAAAEAEAELAEGAGERSLVVEQETPGPPAAAAEVEPETTGLARPLRLNRKAAPGTTGAARQKPAVAPPGAVHQIRTVRICTARHLHDPEPDPEP